MVVLIKLNYAFFFHLCLKVGISQLRVPEIPEELSVLDCGAFSGLEQNKAHKGFPQALEPKSCCGLKTA